jgi:hypothetical protein
MSSMKAAKSRLDVEATVVATAASRAFSVMESRPPLACGPAMPLPKRRRAAADPVLVAGVHLALHGVGRRRGPGGIRFGPQ